MDDMKTRQEIKGRVDSYKQVYNQKTVRQWETMRLNREAKRYLIREKEKDIPCKKSKK